MSALMWWLIPLGATLLALAWAASRSRPRRAAGTHETVGDMARFRAAMDRPLPSEGPDRPVSSDPVGRPPATRPTRSRRPVERRNPA